ncbi:MAG: hypothetical protein ACFCD0_16500 [Gemmataceae bacterium]
MSTINMPPMVIVGRRKRTRSYPNFDAELDETVCDRYNNANLTLKLKLGFRQINPAGGAAAGTYHDYGRASAPTRNIIRWTPGSWALWKDNFLRTAQRFWNGKFWLINNFPVLEFVDQNVQYRHNVYCRFRLIGADANPGTHHHHVIDVVRLAPGENWFGSHSRLYDSRDTELVQKNTDSAGRPVMQRAHVHEVGHLLGLGHSAEGTPACPVTGNTNAAACYGTTDHDMTSVMGSGMDLRPEHAWPWRSTIADMTNRGVVRTAPENRALRSLSASIGTTLGITPPVFVSNDWTAVMQRHYPRTQEEVRTNAAVTSRPNRG